MSSSSIHCIWRLPASRPPHCRGASPVSLGYCQVGAVCTHIASDALHDADATGVSGVPSVPGGSGSNFDPAYSRFRTAVATGTGEMETRGVG